MAEKFNRRGQDVLEQILSEVRSPSQDSKLVFRGRKPRGMSDRPSPSELTTLAHKLRGLRSTTLSSREQRYLVSAFSASLDRQKILEELATKDSLTGVSNLRQFEEDLGSAINIIRRRNRGNEGLPESEKIKTREAIVYIDLIGLTKINKMGQGAGNNALCAVVEALTTAKRKNEEIARIGGDEFAMILSSNGNNPDFINDTVERLEQAMHGCKYEYKDKFYPAQVYIAAYEIKGDMDVRALMDHTGELLAAAKLAAGVGRAASEAKKSDEGPGGIDPT